MKSDVDESPRPAVRGFQELSIGRAMSHDQAILPHSGQRSGVARRS
jgi:hypothetical protein